MLLEEWVLETVLLERRRYTRYARFAWSRCARLRVASLHPGNERNMLLMGDLGEVLSCRILSFFLSFFLLYIFFLTFFGIFIYILGIVFY